MADADFDVSDINEVTKAKAEKPLPTQLRRTRKHRQRQLGILVRGRRMPLPMHAIR